MAGSEPSRRVILDGGGLRPTAPHAVVIMAKAPVAGVAKTRLIPALSAAQAAALHHAFLCDTIRLAHSISGVDVAVMCPRGDGRALASALDDSVFVVEQRGDGLGAALADVLERFPSSGYDGVVALDSDSPHLPAPLLREAVTRLAQADLVIGPTDDGGYYLVGARRAYPGLFERSLGTGDALSALLHQAGALGLQTWIGPEWYDIDRPDDLNRLSAELRERPERAPATAALLERWGTGPANR